MRIGLTGAGATGKSSLLQFCKKDTYFKNHHFYGSVTRDVFKQHGMTSELDQYDSTPEKNFDLQRNILVAKIKQQNVALGRFKMVSDRILLDHYAYLCVRNTEIIDNQYFHDVREATLHNIRQYELVVYFEMFDDVRTQGFRDSSDTVRYTVDAVIRSVVLNSEYTNGTKVIVMSKNDSVPKRASLMKAVIDEMSRKTDEI